MKINYFLIYILGIVFYSCASFDDASENMKENTIHKAITLNIEATEKIKDITYYLEHKITPKFFTIASFTGTLTSNNLFEGESVIGVDLSNGQQISIWLQTNYIDNPEFLLPNTEIKFDTIFSPGIIELTGIKVSGQCYYSRGTFDPPNGDSVFVSEIWRLKSIQCIK